eukprot:506316_1
MGACVTLEEKDEEKDEPKQEICNIALLGSTNCGKSTLFRQAKLLYGKDGFKTHIVKSDLAENLFDVMLNIVGDQNFNLEMLNKDELAAAELFKSMKGKKQQILTPANSSNIKTLWNNVYVKTVLDEEGHDFWVGGRASGYFFDSLDRISSPQYEPTDKDFLLNGHKTTGYNNIALEYQNVTWKFFDIGGSAGERKKWKQVIQGNQHMDNNMTALIYVISLASHDQRTRGWSNSFIYTLDSLRFVFNNNVLPNYNIPIFLIFNKKDMFDSKIVNQSLLDGIKSTEPEFEEKYPEVYTYFDQYYDENEYFNECKSDEDIIEKNQKFIQNLILQQIPNDYKENVITSYVTCAYDGEQIKNVFDDMLDCIIQLRENT